MKGGGFGAASALAGATPAADDGFGPCGLARTSNPAVALESHRLACASNPLCCLFASAAANATDWQAGMCSLGFAATPEATRLEPATLSTTPSGRSPLSPARAPTADYRRLPAVG